jgi:hypothetical protein
MNSAAGGMKAFVPERGGERFAMPAITVEDEQGGFHSKNGW